MKSYLLGVLFIITSIASQSASAVTVWQSTWKTDRDRLFDFYLVTDFDNAIDARSGTILDLYIDFSRSARGLFRLSPGRLLYQSSSELAASDPIDFYFTRNRTAPLLASNGGGIGIGSALTTVYQANQDAIFNLACMLGQCSIQIVSGRLPRDGFGDVITGLSSFSIPRFNKVATSPVSTVPIPAAAWLFMTGILGFWGLRKKTLS